MRKNQVHNIERLRHRRKELRSSLTPAEAFLWKRLQRSQLDGRKFRRQHSFGKYVLDFYCPSEKLAVELDGIIHFTEEGSKYDEERTDYLSLHGICVVRFENAEVFERTDEVLERIKGLFKNNHPAAARHPS